VSENSRCAALALAVFFCACVGFWSARRQVALRGEVAAMINPSFTLFYSNAIRYNKKVY
jgi:hypothetical protein